MQMTTLAFSKYFEYVTFSTLVVCIFSIVLRAVEGGHHASMSERSFGKQLVDQAKQWYSLALQDRKPMNAYEHSLYAIAYLNAARHVTHDSILEQYTGVNIHALLKSATQTQQEALKDLNKQCPKIKVKASNPTWL
jgi:hypothetical protein